MATFSVTWDKFKVHQKHDIDRDRPYLWVFGIVIDSNTIESRRFVTRRRSDSRNLETASTKKYGKGDSTSVPSALDLDVAVKPFAGVLTAGVAVVAWENAMTTDKVIADAYDAAADALDDLIGEIVDDRLEDIEEQLENGVVPSGVDELNQVELAGLTLTVEQKVRDTIKAGWTIFQLVHDHQIGSAFEVVSLDDDHAQDLDFRFKKKKDNKKQTVTVDYELDGRLSYSTASSSGATRPEPPPGPPSKGLQSPKPTAQQRVHPPGRGGGRPGGGRPPLTARRTARPHREADTAT